MSASVGSSEGGDDADDRAELAALVRSARATLEWHDACGADAMPSGVPVRELFGPLRRPAAAPAVPQVERAEQPRSMSVPAAEPRPARPEAPPASPTVAAPPAPKAGPPAIVPIEERRTRLSVLAETVSGCTKCGLAASRKQTVFARGNPAAELVFVGEGPGADEDARGEPFVGKAGQLLDKMIAAMGLSQDDVYICNIVKCRPPDNRVPEPAEMAACLPYLNAQLDLIAPKVIVALGTTALKGLLGPSEGIMKARGTWKIYRGAIPLMPTFHPAYVLRQPTREVRALVWGDLQQVLKELGRPVPSKGA